MIKINTENEATREYINPTVQNFEFEVTHRIKCEEYVNNISLSAIPLARSLEQWIWTRENYARICLHEWNIFLNLAFGQVGEIN